MAAGGGAAQGGAPRTAGDPPSSAGEGGVRVLCFGVLRERLGPETVIREPAATVADLWTILTAAHPHLRDRREGVRAARNLSYCAWETPVAPGDEVAFMPPVSGGATGGTALPRIRTALVRDPVDPGALAAGLHSELDGAVACFAGVVRGVTRGREVLRLDYEAYPEMAGRELERIAREVAERHGASALTVVHRFGELHVGEVSIAVIAAAPHRRAAFAACAAAVEAVKRDLPIWKREHHPDGAVWVDAREVVPAGAAASGAGGEELPALSHVDAAGAVRMVDVSDRPVTARAATAEAVVRFSGAAALDALRGGSPKGDVLATARLAGIMATKRTPELIPLCHPLPLSHADVTVSTDPSLPGVHIRSTARCVASTGIEMEALTAAAVAALTVIDMLKAVDPWATVETVRLLDKSGGRSGSVRRPS